MAGRYADGRAQPSAVTTQTFRDVTRPLSIATRRGDTRARLSAIRKHESIFAGLPNTRRSSVTCCKEAFHRRPSVARELRMVLRGSEITVED